MKFKSNIKTQGQQTKAHGPESTDHLILSSLWSENIFFIFLNGQAKNKGRRVFFDMWKLYEIQISVSIHKVLLEHSHIHSFIYCLWLLSLLWLKSWVVATDAIWPERCKILPLWAFTEKVYRPLNWMCHILHFKSYDRFYS